MLKNSYSLILSIIFGVFLQTLFGFCILNILFNEAHSLINWGALVIYVGIFTIGLLLSVLTYLFTKDIKKSVAVAFVVTFSGGIFISECDSNIFKPYFLSSMEGLGYISIRLLDGLSIAFIHYCLAIFSILMFSGKWSFNNYYLLIKKHPRYVLYSLVLMVVFNFLFLWGPLLLFQDSLFWEPLLGLISLLPYLILIISSVLYFFFTCDKAEKYAIFHLSSFMFFLFIVNFSFSSDLFPFFYPPTVLLFAFDSPSFNLFFGFVMSYLYFLSLNNLFWIGYNLIVHRIGGKKLMKQQLTKMTYKEVSAIL